MGVGHQKTRKRTSDLRKHRTEADPSMQKKITTTPEAATQARGEAEAEAKIDLYTSCITSEIWTIG
jgi:hypothetical protein